MVETLHDGMPIKLTGSVNGVIIALTTYQTY